MFPVPRNPVGWLVRGRLGTEVRDVADRDEDLPEMSGRLVLLVEECRLGPERLPEYDDREPEELLPEDEERELDDREEEDERKLEDLPDEWDELWEDLDEWEPELCPFGGMAIPFPS